MAQALKKIGKGTFTTAYLRNDGKVLLKTSDPIKECMAHGWFPKSHLFPTITFGKGHDEYIMRYYPRGLSLKKNLKPKEYQFYLELRAIFANFKFDYSDKELLAGFKTIKCSRRRRIMVEAHEACRNYGEGVKFEISPRNVAVSPTGNLVLLDCFFMSWKLKEVYGDANKRRQQFL